MGVEESDEGASVGLEESQDRALVEMLCSRSVAVSAVSVWLVVVEDME
jgi:hypothetical protein